MGEKVNNSVKKKNIKKIKKCLLLSFNFWAWVIPLDFLFLITSSSSFTTSSDDLSYYNGGGTLFFVFLMIVNICFLTVSFISNIIYCVSLKNLKYLSDEEKTVVNKFAFVFVSIISFAAEIILMFFVFSLLFASLYSIIFILPSSIVLVFLELFMFYFIYRLFSIILPKKSKQIQSKDFNDPKMNLDRPYMTSSIEKGESSNNSDLKDNAIFYEICSMNEPLEKKLILLKEKFHQGDISLEKYEEYKDKLVDSIQ